MSNRRKLRPPVCLAVDQIGRPLARPARYRDPGAYVPSPPHPVRPKPAPKRNRAPSGKPADQYERFTRYATQTSAGRDRDVLTPKQARRWRQKLHAQYARKARQS